MAREDFDYIAVRRELVPLAMLTSKRQSKSAYFTGLVADGLKYRLLAGKLRPPKPLLYMLNDEEVFTLFAQWQDAILTDAGTHGPLGSKYELALVMPSLDYAEKDNRETYIPVVRGSCDDVVETQYGRLPICTEPLAGLDFDPLPADQLEALKNWLGEKG